MHVRSIITGGALRGRFPHPTRGAPSGLLNLTASSALSDPKPLPALTRPAVIGYAARSGPEIAPGIALPAVPLASMRRPSDPVLALVVERAKAGSQPGRRADGACLALAIEGGAMAGAVSGGMCAALEALGLIGSFDVIYGCSAGSMNASYTVAGQAQSRSALYALAAGQGLVDRRWMLRRESPIRTGQIVNLLFQAHPHLPRVLEDAPPLRIVASRVDDRSVCVLGSFASLDEVRKAIWASSCVPFRSHDLVRFRGVDYVDGGLTEPLPYRVALRDGATHVLVLRCRPAGYRRRDLRGPQRKMVERLFRDVPEPVVELIGAYPALYNACASELASGGLDGRVAQLAPDARAGLFSSLEQRPRRLMDAVAVGAATVYGAMSSGGVGLLLADPANPRVAMARAA